MKKIVCFLFLTSFLLAACAPQETHIAETATETVLPCPAIEDFPTEDELANLNAGEIIRLRLCAEELPLDSCEEYFTDELNAFLGQYENAMTDSFIIHEDKLSLIPGENKKSLRNWKPEIRILIDAPFDAGNFDLAEEIGGQASEFLRQYSLFSFKASEWNIFVIDRKDNILYNIGGSSFSDGENLFAPQPEDEYAVQTLAFQFSAANFFKPEPDYSLRKFGLIEESSELYVEYTVSEAAFDYRNMEDSMENLEAQSRAIKEYLLDSPWTEEYLSSHGVTRLTVSFYISILGEGCAYSFDL